MANDARNRERAIWIAVVSVLATTLVWLAVVSGVSFFVAHSVPAQQTLAVARVLGHVVMILAMRAWPALPLLAFGGIMLGLVFRPSTTEKREVRHA